MKADYWIAVGVILSTLLAPLLAKLVDLRVSRPPPEGHLRRKTDRQELDYRSVGLLGMVWTCLPFVLALSLDIYVIVYYPGQSGLSARPVPLIHDLALVMAGLKVSAMAAIVVLHGLREVTRTNKRALRDQEEALKEMLRANLEPIVISLATLGDKQKATQRKLVAKDKALVAALTKAHDELAGAYAQLLREIRASHQRPRSQQAQSQEPLPERKPSATIKHRRDAAG